MRFVFIVQGEGRGHMTQAISLFNILTQKGHEVCCVAVGISKRRKIPDYFFEQIHCPIHPIKSPNFVTDDQQKSILVWQTIIYNLKKIGTYYDSLKKLDQLNTHFKPDVIINFYDMLGGLYNGIYRPEARFVAIGHQYLAFHPNFKFAKGKLQKSLFLLNTRMTSWGAGKVIALSLTPYTPSATPKFLVWPPLLRGEIKEVKSTSHNFYLAYIVNPGYFSEILSEAEKNPDLNIVAFWDQKDMPDPYRPLPNLIFHQINDRLFLEKMAACKGLLTTAGFETICEALYLGKQSMMVPVSGHYEQQCNALDASLAGAGILSQNFDLHKLHHYLATNTHKNQDGVKFKAWQHTLDKKINFFLDSLEDSGDSPANPFPVHKKQKNQ
ncbi:glycosyltransferase family protein [Negadavirga shengliensis]|uniref:Glycosyltransferase family protein n=1 Tax=Negadavirga shengliensis TaxID=1389218 RepID=A0ABV9T2Y6_9BACT